MYKKIITASLTFCLASIVPLANAKTLNEIYQQALENDHQYKAAEAALRAGQQSKKIGRANLLPQINAEGSWTQSEVERSGAEDQFDRDTLSILRDAPIDTATDSTTTGYSVTLSQALFDLSAWHAMKGGQLQSKVAEAQFQAEKQALIIRTAEAYFNVLRAIDNFETAKAEENANGRQLEQTQKRFEVGLTAITEVHEAQAAYDNSVARRLLQEGNVGISFEALEVLTGQAHSQLSPLKSDFPITPPSPVERQQWVDFAVNNNFTLAATSLQARSAREASKQARSDHLPTLTGQIRVASYNADDSNSFAGLDGDLESDIDTDTTAVGLTLSVPIFSGGRTSALSKQSAERFIQAQEVFYKAQRDTIQSARSLHLTVLTDVATIKARQQAITSSRSALDATQAGYEVGTRDLVDVLIAQRTLFTAQGDYYNALYTYVMNTLRLKEVAGILSEKDVLELDAWLDTSKQVSRNTAL